jgi:uncharacterized protein (DUF2236 family)
VIPEFLRIMRSGAVLPRPIRPLQRLITTAAIDLLPADLRAQIGLAASARCAARSEPCCERPPELWEHACTREPVG